MPDKKKKIRFDDPRENKTKWRNDCRRVDVQGKGTWQWRTNGIDIQVYDPDGKRHQFSVYDAYGVSEDEHLETVDWDMPHLLIDPSLVRDYIANDFSPPDWAKG